MWADRRERADQKSNERVFVLSVFPVQCPTEEAEPRACVGDFYIFQNVQFLVFYFNARHHHGEISKGKTPKRCRIVS